MTCGDGARGCPLIRVVTCLQCGFCTPGMLVTAMDIVNRLGADGERSGPTPDVVRRELAGNICRCTGYMGLVSAITEVANGAATDHPENGEST